MWDKIFKKKTSLPGFNPGKKDEDGEEVEAPEVEDTLGNIDAALKKADQIAAKKKQEAFEQAEREAQREARRGGGSRCGCGW